jgi:hypothetical protein
LTYGGVDLSDFEILLPSACNMTGLRIRPSTPDSGNMVRRVRVTELSGSTVGNGILLDQLVYSWRFEDVIVDHFLNGYNFTGQNHFTNIIGGQNRNNGIGFNHEVTLGSSNIVVSGVDIEGCVSYCFDIYTGSAWSIYGNYMDNGSSSGTRAIRIGGGGTVPTEGISIMNNYFNNGGTANYAIEIGTQGFYGLNIIANHFNNYATANVLNGASAGATAKKGVILGNDQFGSVPEMSSYQGMFTTDNSANVNTTVAGLPTCNVEMQGAHYFVTDLNNTGIGWKNAVTGSGSTGLNVTCNGSTWYQD